MNDYLKVFLGCAISTIVFTIIMFFLVTPYGIIPILKNSQLQENSGLNPNWQEDFDKANCENYKHKTMVVCPGFNNEDYCQKYFSNLKQNCQDKNKGD